MPPWRVPFPVSAALNTDTSPTVLDCNEDQLSDDEARTSLSLETFDQISPQQARLFVREELDAPLLNALYPSLWIGATKDGSHIDALHIQLLKGRQVKLDEAAKMHLVWTSNSVHIKPIPRCLYSHDFWQRFLCHRASQQDSLSNNTSEIDAARSLALGFLRSITYLIQRPSDLNLAHQNNLVPSDLHWPAVPAFIVHFRYVSDDEVARRYHFGQIRLSRLNLIVRLCWLSSPSSISREREVEKKKRGVAAVGWFYEPPYWSAGPYLQSITTSLAFFLATISIVLSAMQVSLRADLEISSTKTAFRLFATIVLAATALLSTLLAVVPLFFLAWQIQWAVRQQRKRLKESA